MRRCMTPGNRHNSSNKCDSNWRPRSVVIFKGTSKREIQVERRAEATVGASISAMGTASGQREKRSMHVRQFLCEYCITIISKCICSNQPANDLNVLTGEDTYAVILLRWHGLHCRVHIRQSLFTDGQTKRVVTSFCVARSPGWESLCSDRNTVRRNGSGTNDHRSSVKRS